MIPTAEPTCSNGIKTLLVMSIANSFGGEYLETSALFLKEANIAS